MLNQRFSVDRCLFCVKVTSMVLLVTFSCRSKTNGSGDVVNEDLLYTAEVWTKPNEFTSGIEGPAADRMGNLYAVNYAEQGTIGVVDSNGRASLFVRLPEGSIGNGIRYNRNGDMLVADYTGHNILLIHTASKNISIYAHEGKMSQPNDIAIDSQDRLYASDPNWKEGTGRIWRIDTNGDVVLLDSLGTANGIEVSPDDAQLYVNDAGMGNVWVYDLDANGNVGNKRLLLEFEDEYGMDGMRCDIDGALYITRFGKGEVVKVSPKGEVIKQIKLTGERPTNLTFGGRDGKTVYVTLQDQGNIERFRVERPGKFWE